ncbi:hypothetical protein BDZ85DRAFT_249271 [Elsinoe ampelina]|uniref:Peptidase C15, pyroglutamyl peptidase I-like protein n=1 Tax=Elsinoe ampelina TaxID=302913 RepID=A0A6A6GC22_9PEZI|nr:hypothetical protein BDZ85DRAFT_249271 [Elsinoe ampelina]
MFAKASFVFAAFAVAAQLASAQAPPACLLAVVNTNANPADVQGICKKSSEFNDKLIDLCGDNVDAAQKAFTSVCKNAGVTVTLASPSASATGKGAYPISNITYTSQYYDESCSCSKTATFTTTAYTGSGLTTATGGAGNSTQASPTGTSGSGSGSSGTGSGSSASGSARSSSGTASAAPAATGGASHFQLAGYSLGAMAVAGLAVALNSIVMAPVFNVFVTGFGPFPSGDGEKFEKNASHEVTKLLPSQLAPRSSSNPGDVQINIINPTAAPDAYVKTEYAYIRDYVKKLHADSKQYDLYLHIGMAYGWDFVSVERCAYKQIMTSSWAKNADKRTGYYTTKDNAGKTVLDLGPCPWDGVPIGLAPAFSIDDTIDRAKTVLRSQTAFAAEEDKEIVIKQHEEAGTYCCGFIYYESLANKWKKGEKANVLFCHVPGETDEKSLQRARDAIVAVIASATAQLIQEDQKA